MIKNVWHMKKIHIPIFAVLVLVISFSIHDVYAATPSITVSPPSVSVGGFLTVNGTGFTPGELFIFLDTLPPAFPFPPPLVDHVTILADGTFSIAIPVLPTTTGGPVTPGPHIIYVSYSPDGSVPLALASFTITAPSIPEFPFSFNLVIMFVAVAAVYMVIRQKMTASFKRY